MSEQYPDGYLKEMMFRVPAGRVGEARELVAAALFLASDGSYITGVLLLPFDGGILATQAAIRRRVRRGHGRIVNVSVNETTMTQAGFVPYGPSRAGSDALSRIMAADLNNSDINVNLLLPGRPTLTGMIPEDHRPANIELLDPAIIGPPIVWLASRHATAIHDPRIVATRFKSWLEEHAPSPV